MSSSLIDLRTRTRGARVYLAAGAVLTCLVALGCAAALLFGPDEPAVRIAAGSAVLVLLVVVAAVWRTRRRQVRTLGVDHEGIRLLNHRGRVLSGFAWGDLAGVGLLTNEAVRQRRLSARGGLFEMPSMVWVPTWLELHPAGPDAVRRHPELTAAWELGRRQRWLVAIGSGPGQSFEVVGEHVRRWRPELWRGHREGSVLSG
ncbi:MAG: hypothetical protein L0H64_11160 [Pseudonocardia sp.]|nr:hypothetical protein [Pseudonocardia sp.]